MNSRPPFIWEFLCIDCNTNAVLPVQAAVDCRRYSWHPAESVYLVEPIHTAAQHGFIVLEAPEKIIAQGPPNVCNARWSPSGRLIAYVTPSRPEHMQHIMGIYDPAKNKTYHVHTEHNRFIQDPVWTPDERSIVAMIEGPRTVPNKSGPMEICLFELNKKGPERVVRNEEPDSFICDHIISRDGHYLAYLLTRCTSPTLADAKKEVLSEDEINELMMVITDPETPDGAPRFGSELKILDLNSRTHLFENALGEYNVKVFTWVTGQDKLSFTYRPKGTSDIHLASLDLITGRVDRIDDNINDPGGEDGTPTGRIDPVSLAHPSKPLICYVKWAKGHANEVHTFNVATGQREHVYTGHFVHAPRWSRISDKILVMESHGKDDPRLYPVIVDTNDKSSRKILPDHESFGWLNTPKWSYDERFITARKSAGILVEHDE